MTESLRAYRERRKAEGFVRLEMYVPKGEIELVKTIVKRISDPAVGTEWLSELKALTANETVTDLKVLLQSESLERLELPDRTGIERGTQQRRARFVMVLRGGGARKRKHVRHRVRQHRVGLHLARVQIHHHRARPIFVPRRA